MPVYLIRHGQTAANAARVVQRPEVPLSERGISQARRLARRLAGEGIVHILSSDLRRAAMTAEALAEATSAPIEFESLLHERNFGDVRGTPYAQLDFDLFGPDYEPPGGESWPIFHRRVERAWARVQETARSHGNLAVVTHGLVCESLVSRHARLAVGVAPRGSGWANTSVTILEAGNGGWSVRLLNCTDHLDEAAASGPRSAGSAGPPGGLA